MHEKTCLYCPTPVARTRRTCLSTDCVGADSQAWLDARSERRKHRQRPASRSNLTAPQRLIIHERCNWTCHICGYPIDPDALWPDDEAAVVDHIVPLALGGTNDPTNLASAHSYCNLVKGRRRLSDVV